MNRVNGVRSTWIIVLLALSISTTAAPAELTTCREIVELSTTGERGSLMTKLSLNSYSVGVLMGLKMARDSLTASLNAQRQFPALADCVPVTELTMKTLESISIEPLDTSEFGARIGRACARPENADRPMVEVSQDIIRELMAAAAERATAN
jgi:hypothetical protein